MTDLDINVFLEGLLNEPYLEILVKLKKKEKEYKKSDFYKLTKINIFELYKNYYVLYQQRYGLMNKITEIIESINEEALANKIESLIKTDVLQDLLSKFDVDKILNESEDFKKTLRSLK